MIIQLQWTFLLSDGYSQTFALTTTKYFESTYYHFHEYRREMTQNTFCIYVAFS